MPGMVCDAQLCTMCVCMPDGPGWDTEGAICVQDEQKCCCHQAITIGGNLNQTAYAERQKTYCFEFPCPVDFCKCGCVNPMQEDGIVLQAGMDQCMNLCAERVQFPTGMCGGTGKYPGIYHKDSMYEMPGIACTICTGLLVVPEVGCCVAPPMAAPGQENMK